MDKANNFFKETGYAVVKSAVSKELRDHITQYALFDEMQNFIYGDGQVNSAHSKYADPAMESILISLQDIMEAQTGLSLFPTYSYYRVYRNGNELDRHIDRPACEISATVCFNYSYENTNYNWPIYLENLEIIQRPGDLLIYKGCEITHWRNKFDFIEDSWQVQGFFHYVDANGPNAGEKWDGRESLGTVKEGTNKGFQNKSNNLPPYIIMTK